MDVSQHTLHKYFNNFSKDLLSHRLNKCAFAAILWWNFKSTQSFPLFFFFFKLELYITKYRTKETLRMSADEIIHTSSSSSSCDSKSSSSSSSSSACDWGCLVSSPSLAWLLNWGGSGGPIWSESESESLSLLLLSLSSFLKKEKKDKMAWS